MVGVMYMRRTQVYLEPEQHSALLKEASEQGISLAELVRRIVLRHLEDKEKGEVQREAYLGIVGIGSSGKSDISERHDRYLGEALRK